MSMKKFVLITALFSLSGIAANQNDKPAQGEKPLNETMKFYKEMRESNVVRGIADWLDEVPLEQRIKKNLITSLAIAAGAGAICRRIGLGVAVGSIVYQLVKNPQPEEPQQKENAVKQGSEKSQPNNVNSEASANVPQGAGADKEASKIAQLAAVTEQASK